MSMNIAPAIPQVTVNASSPSTESLARANSIREVVPAPTKVEASIAYPLPRQKTPEQELKNTPKSQEANDSTYSHIIKQSDPKIVNEINDSNDDAEPDSENDTEQKADNSDINTSETNTSEINASESESNERDADKHDEQQHQAELKEIQQLSRRDNEVKAHEQAHAAVGGSLTGSPSYEYKQGPDGNKYAVSGEVSIDVSVASTPRETIKKMQTVRAAALAPAEPSSQDRKVAAEAAKKIAEAKMEIVRESAELQGQKAQGLDAETENTNNIQVNTDNPIGQEPRKRQLNQISEDNNQVVGASQNEPLPRYESESLKIPNPEPSSITTATSHVSNVVANRYYSSFVSEDSKATGFTAVA